MSVSISLDNGTQLSMGIKIAFGDLHIMRHGIKIDLGPRAPVDMIHKTKPTFTKTQDTYVCVRLRLIQNPMTLWSNYMLFKMICQ